jgi:hypothetical protein
MNLRTLLCFAAAQATAGHGKNLLDVTSTSKRSGINASSLSNGVIDDPSIGSGNSDFLLWAQTFPAGTYTFSCAHTGEGLNGVRFLCNKPFPGNSGYVALYTAYYKDIPDDEITVTIEEDFLIGICLLTRSGHSGEPGKAYNIQFETGDKKTPYHPYKG